MQGKVSMVVPCYNKERYIGAMLDSVLGQEWDNVEVILVNDGSTDGTRGIIAQYEPRLRARGYEVIIVDQENGGCCAAVYAGLIRMTGELFCLVDCDDGLEPGYVSRMAGWLQENDGYEWTACSYRAYMVTDGRVEPLAITVSTPMDDNSMLLERHILRKVITTSWVYMVRIGYLKRCRLIENFCTERRSTYEPLFAVPLMLGGGRLKSIDEPLYRFNRFASDMYAFEEFKKVDRYYSDYTYLYDWAIKRAHISNERKDRLGMILKLGNIRDRLYHLHGSDVIGGAVRDHTLFIDMVAQEAVDLLDVFFSPKPCLDAALFKHERYMDILALFDNIILNGVKRHERIDGSRFIAYGVLGRAARYWLPLLRGTRMEPVLFWDMAAGEDTRIGGMRVVRPDFSVLGEGDILLVLPQSPDIKQYVMGHCGGTPVVCAADQGSDILWNALLDDVPYCNFVG